MSNSVACFLSGCLLSTPDAVQCSSLPAPILFQTRLSQTAGTSSAPHGTQWFPSRRDHHTDQTDPGSQPWAPGSPKRESHARRAPRFRISLQSSCGESTVWRSVPPAAPSACKRCPEGGTQYLRSCPRHPGQDAPAVEQQPQSGQKPSLPGRFQTWQYNGWETEGRSRLNVLVLKQTLCWSDTVWNEGKTCAFLLFHLMRISGVLSDREKYFILASV